MSLTTDPNDPRLGHGSDDKPREQNSVYLVLSEEDRKKGFVQPVRRSYVHVGIGAEMDRHILIRPGEPGCGTNTSMPQAIAETYARDPWFYGSTYCCGCHMHRPLREFVWKGTDESLDPRMWTEEKRNTVLFNKEKAP